MANLRPVSFILILLTLFPSLTHAQTVEPRRLSAFDIALKQPRLFADNFDFATDRSQARHWLTTGLLTAALLTYDEKILVETQRLGRKWNISTVDNLKPLISVGNVTVLRGPTDFSSTLYFLGDGWVQLGTASAFLLTGYALDSTRPINTGVELFSGLTAATVTSQVFKRIAGREGPAARSRSGGAWRPFPSYKAYQKSRTTYDAFPSGHVMVTTLSFTIIGGNYPEYESVLWPAQVIYLSALGFGMVNNGIHWAGDYPLGIMLGYVFGKASLRMTEDREKKKHEHPTALLEPEISPSVADDGSMVANLNWEF